MTFTTEGVAKLLNPKSNSAVKKPFACICGLPVGPTPVGPPP
jgi:hypothetical protein